MIEKRNLLEIERIRLLDQVAELQISIGIVSNMQILNLYFYLKASIFSFPWKSIIGVAILE